MRSGTSIGANIHEAQYAQGKKFISKLEIAQKECYETEYWLELLFETDIIQQEEYKSATNDCGAIRKNVNLVIKNSKKRSVLICVLIEIFYLPLPKAIPLAESEYHCQLVGNTTCRKANTTTKNSLIS